MLEDFSDFIRNGFPYFVVLFLLCNPSLADSNFNIQRMVQFDSNGQNFGCRASAINMEAKPLSINYQASLRSCIVTRFQDLTIDQFREIRSKAGGLIVMLPKDIKSLSLEEKEQIYMLEQAMLAQEISIPVYFSKYDADIERIINEISNHRGAADTTRKESAMNEVFNKISANGYQIVVSGASHALNKNSKISLIQGELIPFKQLKSSDDGPVPSKYPVIVITTQYKLFGLTNDAPSNFDTTVLLTLIDAFSKLYNQVQTTPKYRLIFLLTEGGSLLNFQGAKKWLENNIDETSIQNAEFVICLDGIAESTGGLYMHVSKPPKEGTNVHKFYQILRKKTQLYGRSEEKTLEGIHKKINLADTFLSWAHERFSMKRIASFTLSSLKSHTDPQRTSVFSDYSSTAILEQDSQLDDTIKENLQTNTKILAESLATYIFNFNEDNIEEIFTGPMTLSVATSQPYIAPKPIGKSPNVKLTFEKFLKNVKLAYDKPDPREPDFMFYEGEEAKLNVYNVKPAVFDLFLTTMISLYIAAIYFAIIYFPKVYDIIAKLSYSPPTSTQTNGGTNYNHKVKAN